MDFNEKTATETNYLVYEIQWECGRAEQIEGNELLHCIGRGVRASASKLFSLYFRGWLRRALDLRRGYEAPFPRDK